MDLSRLSESLGGRLFCWGGGTAAVCFCCCCWVVWIDKEGTFRLSPDRREGIDCFFASDGLELESFEFVSASAWVGLVGNGGGAILKVGISDRRGADLSPGADGLGNGVVVLGRVVLALISDTDADADADAETQVANTALLPSTAPQPPRNTLDLSLPSRLPRMVLYISSRPLDSDSVSASPRITTCESGWDSRSFQLGSDGVMYSPISSHVISPLPAAPSTSAC